MGYPYYLARTAFPDDAMELDNKTDTAGDATKDDTTAKDDNKMDSDNIDDKTNGSNTNDTKDTKGDSQTDDRKDARARTMIGRKQSHIDTAAMWNLEFFI